LSTAVEQSFAEAYADACTRAGGCAIEAGLMLRLADNECGQCGGWHPGHACTTAAEAKIPAMSTTLEETATAEPAPNGNGTTARHAAVEKGMDARVRAIAERSGRSNPVAIRRVEPGTNGNGAASGHEPAQRVKRAAVEQAARQLREFTTAGLAAEAGCSAAAAREHLRGLADVGVLEPLGNGNARRWRLAAGADAAPSEPNPAEKAAREREPAANAAAGDKAKREAVRAEARTGGDPIEAALAEIARRRRQLDAAYDALRVLAPA
jgi:hypothetical protein